jgi:hypothetical protein
VHANDLIDVLVGCHRERLDSLAAPVRRDGVVAGDPAETARAVCAEKDAPINEPEAQPIPVEGQRSLSIGRLTTTDV